MVNVKVSDSDLNKARYQLIEAMTLLSNNRNYNNLCTYVFRLAMYCTLCSCNDKGDVEAVVEVGRTFQSDKTASSLFKLQKKAMWESYCVKEVISLYHELHEDSNFKSVMENEFLETERELELFNCICSKETYEKLVSLCEPLVS